MIHWDCASWGSKLKEVPTETNEVWPVASGQGHEVELWFASMSSELKLKGASFCKWKQGQIKHHFLLEMLIAKQMIDWDHASWDSKLKEAPTETSEV